MNLEQPPLPGLLTEQPPSVAWVILIQFIKHVPHVLLSERVGHHTLHGLPQYTFPGGKRDTYDLGVWETAQREVAEETGIWISDECLQQAYRHPEVLLIEQEEVRCYGYFALWDEIYPEQKITTLEPYKHVGWQWLPIAELSQLLYHNQLPRQVVAPFWISVVAELELEYLYADWYREVDAHPTMSSVAYLSGHEVMPHIEQQRTVFPDLLSAW